MKNRMYKIDNLKALLILLVIFGHVLDFNVNTNINKSLFIFIYSFHMPLFIFLTGFFSKKITVKEYPYKKIILYIYLLFFMKIMFFSANKLFNIDSSFSLFGGIDYYWYLGVVIIYILMIPFIEKFNKEVLLLFSIILAIFAGYDNDITDIFYLTRVFSFFPFFLFGYILKEKKEKIIQILDKKETKFLAATLLFEVLIFMILFINYFYNYRMLFTSTVPYSHMITADNFYATYKTKIIAYIITLITSISIFSLVPNKKIKFITNIGSKTLQIYVFHMPIILLLNNLGIILKINIYFKQYSTIVYFVLSILILIILSDKHIEKLFNKIKTIL